MVQATNASAAASTARPSLLVNWLLLVAGMVVTIVAVGGITRLTESGLSITQWQPITGVLPPLSEAAWQAEFAEYRETPEFVYEAGPAGMNLADFKFIYFWEWFHRLIARLIGLVFALPLIWFWAKGFIPAGYKLRLLALLGLGGLQGLFGWLMVRSGLGGQMTDVIPCGTASAICAISAKSVPSPFIFQLPAATFSTIRPPLICFAFAAFVPK